MNLRTKVAAVGASLGVIALPSHAALDAAVTTAVTTAQADITEAGVLLIGVAAAVMGLRWVKAMFF